MKRILVVLVLWVVFFTPLLATTLGSWNAETGDFSTVASTVGSPTVVTTPVMFGTYAYRVPSDPGNPAIRTMTGIGLNTIYVRAYLRVDVVTNPGGDTVNDNLMRIIDSTATSGASFLLSVSAAGVVQLATGVFDRSPVSANVTINENQTYLIEMRVVRHASAGELQWRLNGLTQSTDTGLALGANPIDRVNLVGSSDIQANGGVANIYWDEIAISDSNYLGSVTAGNTRAGKGMLFGVGR